MINRLIFFKDFSFAKIWLLHSEKQDLSIQSSLRLDPLSSAHIHTNSEKINLSACIGGHSCDGMVAYMHTYAVAWHLYNTIWVTTVAQRSISVQYYVCVLSSELFKLCVCHHEEWNFFLLTNGSEIKISTEKKLIGLDFIGI